MLEGQNTELAVGRRDCWMLAILLLLAALFNWPLLPHDAGYTVDANRYLAGAISLAEGEDYRAIDQLGRPWITHYPPLYSAYLSLFMRVGPGFPECVPGLNAAMLLLSLGAVGVLFLILRQHKVPASIAVLLSLTLGLSPTWLLLVSMMFSDVMFTLIGFLLAWLWFRKAGPPVSTPALLATGVLLTLAYLTRSAALAWLGGAVLVLWLRCGLRQPKIWLLTLLPSMFALIWWRHRTSMGFNYADDFQTRFQSESYLGHCLENLWGLIGGGWFLDTLSPALVRAGGTVEAKSAGGGYLLMCLAGLIALAVVLLAALGCWQNRDDRTKPILCFLAVYLAELVLWPFSMGNRSVFVFAPFLMVWCWQGYLYLGRSCQLRRLTQLGAAILLLNLLLNVTLLVRQQRGLNQPANLQELHAAAEWVNTHVPKDTPVAVADYVPMTHFWSWTRREFVGGNAFFSTKIMEQNHVQYLLNPGDELVEKLPAGWSKAEVFRSANGSYVIFRLMAGAEGN